MGRVGWTGRERLKRKGIYLCIWMIDDVVQEKLMQHCKAIILQFKKYNKKLKRGMCVCVYVYICVYIYMCVCIYVSVFHVKSLLILPQLRKTPKISLDGWCRTWHFYSRAQHNHSHRGSQIHGLHGVALPGLQDIAKVSLVCSAGPSEPRPKGILATVLSQLCLELPLPEGIGS